MEWGLGLSATVVVLLLAIISATVTKISAKSSGTFPLQEYLLANTTLPRWPVISLLLSSSFGINAVLYQVWLGYSVGAWGLIAQLAWSFSFILLSRHSSIISSERSIHGLIGKHYGSSTRLLAGICSIVGIMLLISWETEIGRVTFTSLISSGYDSTNGTLINPERAGYWLLGATVIGCMVYTLVGGLKGNATADLFLNGLKIGAIVVVTLMLLNRPDSPSLEVFLDTMFPSLSTMEKNIGYGGLVTNIVFSILWQYVDASTWQSIIAGGNKSVNKTASNLRVSGYAIFIAPGVIGTVLGVSLAGAPNVTSENVLSQVVLLSGGYSNIVLFLAFSTIVACMLSLIDGLVLAAAYTTVVDVTHHKSTLSDLDSDQRRAERLLATVRLSIVVIVLLAVWFIPSALRSAELSLFDFLYVVIIAQLAIFGPVATALGSRNSGKLPLWLAILMALLIGFGCVILGTKNTEYKSIIDWAGTVTALVSLLLSIALTRKRVPSNTQRTSL